MKSMVQGRAVAVVRDARQGGRFPQEMCGTWGSALPVLVPGSSGCCAWPREPRPSFGKVCSSSEGLQLQEGLSTEMFYSARNAGAR